MKKCILSFLLSCLVIITNAQEQDPKEAAKTFIRSGDYTNAIGVLNRALQKDPNNLEMQKDLAFAYYLHRDYAKALEIAKGFPARKDVDVQAYQILGMAYKAVEKRKDAEQMYEAALKKFPMSGPLYNEYGELLWAKKDFAIAAKTWEKGIETDPNYPGNYYNVAKFYFYSVDKIWGLIYGEMFVNLESYSQRTVEIKTLVLEGYKKLFSEDNMVKHQNMKNEFVKSVIETLSKHSAAINIGITTETLTALRTKFILDWYEKNAARFPFRLFDLHRQLLKNGMFDAYNQWLFGAAENLMAYQTWVSSHTEENDEFIKLHKNRLFKVPIGQYYQNVPVK